MAAGQHQRKVRALRHELLQFVGALQCGARAACLQDRLRMHQHAVPVVRHGHAHQPVRRGQHQAAQQHGPQVVAMLAAAGDRLANQGVRIQLLARQRRIEQGIGRDQGRHARSGGTAHAGTQGNALPDLHLEAERQRQRFAQRDQRRTGGIARRIQRQVDGGAVDAGDAHIRRLDATHRHGVADAFDHMAQDVEPHAHVAHRCRRKRTCLLPHAHSMSFVPGCVTASRPAPRPRAARRRRRRPR